MVDWFHFYMTLIITAAEKLLHRWGDYHRGKLPPGPPTVAPPLELTRPDAGEPELRDGQREFAW
jgi:hypothetical protein